MPELFHYMQQLVNGLTIGSTYALIAIGYTMVYGIIGMINFAHGEVYMIGSYVTFIVLAGLAMLGIHSLPVLMIAGFAAAILVTSAYGYSIERVAYRPLRNRPRPSASRPCGRSRPGRSRGGWRSAKATMAAAAASTGSSRRPAMWSSSARRSPGRAGS